MPKISIIVPVYNTEKYLKKCLDSLINQTFKDMEIIIINDGSTDNSEDIIKEYQEKYSNKIKSYKKENGGLSSARNYGITKANGEYIAFIDSDDYIDLELFEKLEKEINNNTDLIKIKLSKVNNKYEQVEKIDGPVFSNKTGEEAFNELVFKDILIEPACLYIYKKEIFIKNNFKFALSKYNEDFGLTPLIILKSGSVSSLDIYGYYYLQTQESITRNKDYKKTLKSAKDLLFHYDNMIKEIQNYEIEKQTKENILLYYTNAVLLKIKELNKTDQKEYIKEIKKRKMIKNVKIKNFKQLIKRVVLILNIRIYSKLK